MPIIGTSNPVFCIGRKDSDFCDLSDLKILSARMAPGRSNVRICMSSVGLEPTSRASHHTGRRCGPCAA